MSVMKISPFNIRVWNEEYEIMYGMDQLLTWQFSFEGLFSEEPKSNLKRMRSVGFCDRTGREIYQKDFVEINREMEKKIVLTDWIPELAKFGWGEVKFSSCKLKKKFESIRIGVACMLTGTTFDG